jgi:hypothetical protein
MVPFGLTDCELTGEFRPPKTGEWYLSESLGLPVQAGDNSKAYRTPMYIVRPREQKPAPPSFPIPEGYEMIACRAPKVGELYLHGGNVLTAQHYSRSVLDKIKKPILLKVELRKVGPVPRKSGRPSRQTPTRKRS